MSASNSARYAYPHHLLRIADMPDAAISALIERTGFYFSHNKQDDKKSSQFRGRTQINLFYESSTRTRSSFEIAGKRLGMDVININSDVMATKKGEGLLDTAQTLSAMQPDILVIRHPQSGAAHLFADFCGCPVINAGDGCHAHPTQALLDAFTLQQKKGSLTGLRIAICGDIAHSRVARSNAQLLPRLGASVVLVGPPQFMPAKAETLGCDIAYRLKDGLKNADIVMMLRVQAERMAKTSLASIREYFHLYGLTYERLAWAKPDALVMHPGPINRGVEIETALADDTARHVILDQVEAGVALRMALLEDMLTK